MSDTSDWTKLSMQERLECGRFLFGIAWNPEDATEEQKIEILMLHEDTSDIDDEPDPDDVRMVPFKWKRRDGERTQSFAVKLVGVKARLPRNVDKDLDGRRIRFRLRLLTLKSDGVAIGIEPTYVESY